MADGAPPLPPRVGLNLGITGHRTGHPSFARNADAIAVAITDLFASIDAAVAAVPRIWDQSGRAPVRLHSLLANGTDQLAAERAQARGWDLVAPLPCSRQLNAAINARPMALVDARVLIAGGMPDDAAVAARAAHFASLADAARLFELGEDDGRIAELFCASLAVPDDAAAAQLFAAELSARVALAGRVMIEQSDVIIGVWDGVTSAHVGGTGHTIKAALACGVPVLHINPADPQAWRVLRSPEGLADRTSSLETPDAQALAALVHGALHPGEDQAGGVTMLDRERWHGVSNRLAHAYRRVEALFGSPSLVAGMRSLKQLYPAPASVHFVGLMADRQEQESGSTDFADAVAAKVVRRFAWVDAVSARLSDAYRSGMIINFILSSLAIVGGIAYLPLAGTGGKWGFALFELTLLCAILIITGLGRRRRWHARWFQTRRLAEYLRHAPLMLMLGAARSPGRWPRGAETSWPEFYARHALRELGLPAVQIDGAYLRNVLNRMITPHVTAQRDYHFDKARRLTRVHHRLDRLSTTLFACAVLSVTLYLGLRVGVGTGILSAEAVDHASKWFTLFGVMLPTFGAGIAGIRYFGDFERFAAISEVTAQKLDSVATRLSALAKVAEGDLRYADVAELAHATDDIVFAEIENWQSVFGGKHMTVPV